jgi:hypothetical protein
MVNHRIILSPAERQRPQTLPRRRSTTLQQRWARILLTPDVGGELPAQTDAEVAATTLVEVRTVARVRAEFAATVWSGR